MKISHLIMLSVIAGLIIVIIHKNSLITNLNKEISCKNDFLALMEANVKIALRLQTKPVWYIVYENKVSSMPNGQGEIINLSDKLVPIGNRMGIRHPFTNTKIRFSPSESMGQAYTVAGELLAYEYLDD